MLKNKIGRGVLAAMAPIAAGVLMVGALNNGVAVSTNSFGYVITYITGLLSSQMILAFAMGLLIICVVGAFMGEKLRVGFVAIGAVLVTALIVPSMVTAGSTALPTAEMIQKLVS